MGAGAGVDFAVVPWKSSVMLIRSDGTARERASIHVLPRWGGIKRSEKAAAVLDLSELIRPLGEVTRRSVESALILCGGNRAMAAKYLQISRPTLYRWVKLFKAENEASARA